MKKKSLKVKENLKIGLIILFLVIVIVVSILIIKDNVKLEVSSKESDVNSIKTELQESKTFKITYEVNNDCTNYVDSLENYSLNDMLDSKYNTDIYEYDSYYLVCFSNVVYESDDLSIDLNTALNDGVVGIDELNEYFKNIGIDKYILDNTSYSDADDDTSSDDSSASESSSSQTSGNTSSSSNSQKSGSTSSSSSSTSGSTSLENVLNSVTLNPTLTRNTELDNKIESIINSTTNSSMSTYEKVKALYDYVINNMTYSLYVLNSNKVTELRNTYSYNKLDAEIVLMANDAIDYKTGVCDNYTSLFVVLTRRLGLESYYVEVKNSSGGGHVTANIKINGVYYTFDTQGEDKMANGGTIKYYYFGKTDGQINYSAVYRDESIAKFNNFKENSSNVFTASITINGTTYSAKSASKNTITITDLLELTIPNDGNIEVSISASEDVTYYWNFGDFIYSSATSGAVSSNSSFYINQTSAIRSNLAIRLKDSSGRYIDFIIPVNFKISGESLSAHIYITDYNLDGGFYIGVSAYNGTGEITWNATLIDSDDSEANPVVEVQDAGYTFKITNVSKESYYYTFLLTATDASGTSVTIEKRVEKAS